MIRSIITIFFAIQSVAHADVGRLRSDAEETRHARNLQDCAADPTWLCGVDKTWVFHKNKKAICIGDADVPNHLLHGDACGCGPKACPVPPQPCSAVTNSVTCTYTGSDGTPDLEGWLLCHNAIKSPTEQCMSDTDTLSHQVAHGAKLGDFCVTTTKSCSAPAVASCSDPVKPKKCTCTGNSECVSGKCKLKNGVGICN